ncbi:MAG: hypothetical protein ACO4AU_09945 [bacterium]|jgi:hypothetical protein
MRLMWVGLSLLLFGCSDQYVQVHDLPAKPVRILPGYTVLFCECLDNALQQKLVQELQSRAVPVRKLARFEDFNQVEPGKYYALFGMRREVSGSPRTYAVTRLEGRSESGSCGDGCTWSRSWNELIREPAQTEGTSSHESVMLYRVDEETELVLALSQGQRYRLQLEVQGDTGADTSAVEERREYEITR